MSDLDFWKGNAMTVRKICGILLLFAGVCYTITMPYLAVTTLSKVFGTLAGIACTANGILTLYNERKNPLKPETEKEETTENKGDE